MATAVFRIFILLCFLVAALALWRTRPPLGVPAEPAMPTSWLALAPADSIAAIATENMTEGLADLTDIVERFTPRLEMGLNTRILAESGLDLNGPAVLALQPVARRQSEMLQFVFMARVNDSVAFDAWAGTEQSPGAQRYREMLILEGGRDGAAFFRMNDVAAMSNSPKLLREVIDNMHDAPVIHDMEPPSPGNGSLFAITQGDALTRLGEVWPSWSLIAATLLDPSLGDPSVEPKTLTISLQHEENLSRFDVTWLANGDATRLSAAPLAYSFREDQVSAMWNVAWTESRASALADIVLDLARQTGDPVTIATIPEALTTIESELAFAMVRTNAGPQPLIAVGIEDESEADRTLASWLPHSGSGADPYTPHAVGDTWYSMVDKKTLWLSPSREAIDMGRLSRGDKERTQQGRPRTFDSAILLDAATLQAMNGFLKPRIPEVAQLFADIQELQIEQTRSGSERRITGAIEWKPEN